MSLLKYSVEFGKLVLADHLIHSNNMSGCYKNNQKKKKNSGMAFGTVINHGMSGSGSNIGYESISF